MRMRILRYLAVAVTLQGDGERSVFALLCSLCLARLIEDNIGAISANRRGMFFCRPFFCPFQY